MSFEAQKITGYASGIAALPDKVEGRAAWLKAQFDARTDNEVKTQHNALCDALGAQDAAASIGAQAPAGVAANPAPAAGAAASVQAVLQGLAQHTDAHAARTDNPHGVTAAQLNAYTRAQTDAAIAARVVEIGAGDMAQAVYDPQGLGLPLLPQNGDGTQVTAVFITAQQDEDLCSGESLGVLFGKIARRLASLAGAMEGKAAAAHTHDGRYYTEAEMDALLAEKAATAQVEAAQTTADAAQTKANAAMPKAGGTFTGDVAAISANRAGSVLRNCVVVSSGSSPAVNLVSTNALIFSRA